MTPEEIAAEAAKLEAEAIKVRALIVADFKAVAKKVGMTVAVLAVVAAAAFVGHVL